MDSESTTALPATAEDLTPLEQDVLDEYERLAENMKKVSTHYLPSLLISSFFMQTKQTKKETD